MSAQHLHLSTPEVNERALCMCDHGGACSSFEPGHALHLIQARIAQATPLGWADGIVTASDATNGTLTVTTLEGRTFDLWSAGGAALEAHQGAPVAVHTQYGVLAVGQARFNVRVS